MNSFVLTIPISQKSRYDATNAGAEIHDCDEVKHETGGDSESESTAADVG